MTRLAAFNALLLNCQLEFLTLKEYLWLVLQSDNTEIYLWLKQPVAVTLTRKTHAQTYAALDTHYSASLMLLVHSSPALW